MKHERQDTVLITGASSGIGMELARCFAAEGCRLVLVARRRAPLEELAGELRTRYKTQSEVLLADLGQPQASARLFRHLETSGTRIDVLVNNAGFGANGAFHALPPERQTEMVQVNVMALMELTRLLLPRMIEKRRGGILNVASTASFQPGPYMAVYYATKAFVLSFSEALHEELSPLGITVTALCPGPTATGFAEAARAGQALIFKRSSMSAAAVAAAGHEAFRNKKVIVIPGLRNRVMAFAAQLGPRPVTRKIAGHLNKTT